MDGILSANTWELFVPAKSSGEAEMFTVYLITNDASSE